MAWAPEPVVDAALRKEQISSAYLVFMDFVGAPKRWWPEFGTLRAGGHNWDGTGDFVSVDGLESGSDMESTQTVFTLSGLNPELVALAAGSQDRVEGRDVTVYLQFFHVGGAALPDDDTGERYEIMANLGDPILIWSGVMDRMRFNGNDETTTITLTAENIWVDRNRPPFGLYTFKDQMARFNDRSLRFIASLVKKTLRGFPS